jgi:hypothetical protein
MLHPAGRPAATGFAHFVSPTSIPLLTAHLGQIVALAKEGRFDYLIIEATGISEPNLVAETFAFHDETVGGFCLLRSAV